MQASWCYRCAEAVGWCSMGAGNGCSLPAVAIGVLVLCAGGCGCRVPAGAIGVLRPDAGERYYFGNMGKRNAGQLVLSMR